MVHVAEVTAERDPTVAPEIPWHLAGPPGVVAMQLRSTLPRLAVGAGLARRPQVVAALAALPGAPPVTVSPAGGTVVVGGPGWLGLTAVATVPEDGPAPLDWTMGALRRWFVAALAPLGLRPTIGRVAGAWCPGFSDVAVGGRKLAGLGFRVRRRLVLVRGMLAVRPVSTADWELLVAGHRLLGIELDRAAATSMVEATGDDRWTVTAALERLAAVSV